jgi:signal transduction histidine kinase
MTAFGHGRGAPSRRAPILLVDGVASSLEGLEALLASPGYDIVRVGPGRDALEAFGRRDFAVVVLDVQAPATDGFETATEIRRLAAEEERDVPIIFVAAPGSSSEHIAEGYARGAVDVLPSPLDPRTIRSKVAIFVELFRSRERARLHLEGAVRAREEQLTIVSHDLRNPLTTVLLGARQIEQIAEASADGHRARRAAGHIVKAVDRMNRLVADLHDMAKLDAGHQLPMEMGRHDVAALVRDAAELAQPLANVRQLTLTTDASEPVFVACDQGRVQQVLADLMGNAVKFASEQGAVHVRLERREQEILVSVSDTGTGIPEEQVPHVFDAGWRAETERRHGEGLALPIAKAIVDAHGGRIWIETAIRSGTTFHFTLPSTDGMLTIEE